MIILHPKIYIVGLQAKKRRPSDIVNGPMPDSGQHMGKCQLQACSRFL